MRLRLALAALILSAQSALAEVTVFAAASLKTALDEIAAGWEAETGTAVTVAYGGSAAMARQIEEAAPADIFISAAVDWMDALEEKGLVVAESRRDLLRNRLVLIGHGERPPVTLDGNIDLAGLLAGGRLSIGLVDAVPAGQYGAEALQNLGVWDQVKDSLAQSDNVRAALKLVVLGEAPFGIVYVSDAIAEPGVSVVATFPEGSHQPIVYPAALVVGADSAGAAAFLDYLSTPAAAEVFAANGFLPLP
jgi:molybdate transport system substrate-binding protein